MMSNIPATNRVGGGMTFRTETMAVQTMRGITVQHGGTHLIVYLMSTLRRRPSDSSQRVRDANAMPCNTMRYATTPPRHVARSLQCRHDSDPAQHVWSLPPIPTGITAHPHCHAVLASSSVRFRVLTHLPERAATQASNEKNTTMLT